MIERKRMKTRLFNAVFIENSCCFAYQALTIDSNAGYTHG